MGDRDGVLKADGCALAWQHASHAANDDQSRDRDVDRAVAASMPRAPGPKRCASPARRMGASKHALRGVARRIRNYAGSDTELREVASALLAEELAFVGPMMEVDRKRVHFSSADLQRSRNTNGRALRQNTDLAPALRPGPSPQRVLTLCLRVTPGS